MLHSMREEALMSLPAKRTARVSILVWPSAVHSYLYDPSDASVQISAANYPEAGKLILASKVHNTSTLFRMTHVLKHNT